MTMPDISILIVTYNSADVIGKCLDALLPSVEQEQAEVIVVDNCSKDATLKVLSSYSHSIILKQNSSNVGFSRAMNQAYRLSSGKYIMTFNPDAEVYSDTLTEITKTLSSKSDIGLVAGLMHKHSSEYYYPHQVLTLFEPSITWLTIVKYMPWANKVSRQIQSQPYDCEWVSGTCITVKRDLLDNEGLFAENSFLFWEEYELCKKVKSYGMRIVVNPAVKYKHESSSSFKHDVDKLRTAVKLSNAHKYRIKSSKFNTILCKISLLTCVLDLSIFTGILFCKDVFSTENNSERDRTLSECKTIIKSNLRLLVYGLSEVEKEDTAARLFFNSQP